MKNSFFAPKFMIKCSTCHGGGILPGKCEKNEILPCPTCEGKGVIAHKVSHVDRVEIPCDNPNCIEGRVVSTQIVDGQTSVVKNVCPVCDGFGVMYNQTEEISITHEKCPTCQGKTIIKAEEMRKLRLETLCPECGGKGFKFEKKPLKRMVLFGALTFFQPVVAIATGLFGFMLFSVKETLSKNK